MVAAARAVAIIGMMLQHAFANNDYDDSDYSFRERDCTSAYMEMDKTCNALIQNGEDACSNSTCLSLKSAAATACASVTEMTLTHYGPDGQGGMEVVGSEVVNPTEKMNETDVI